MNSSMRDLQNGLQRDPRAVDVRCDSTVCLFVLFCFVMCVSTIMMAKRWPKRTGAGNKNWFQHGETNHLSTIEHRSTSQLRRTSTDKELVLKLGTKKNATDNIAT